MTAARAQALLAFALALTGCSASATPTPSATPVLPPMQGVYIVGRVYPFALPSHCGVSDRYPALFDGSAWTAVESPGNGLDGDIDVGTLKLTSHDAAIYRSNHGPVLHLRRLPGPVTSLAPCF